MQRSSVGGPRSAYGFAGEEQDPTSGQLFLRARTYNPATGRFLQSDPIMGTPGDPRTLHHYAYAFNNPVNYADPSGLWVGTLQQPRERAQPQNSKLQALINSYTAPLQTQLAYAGSLGKNGFNRSHLGAAGNLGSQGAQRSAIGQEGQFWQNQSDPEPREQSQGHRQGPCGIGSLLVGIRDAGRAVMDTTQKIGQELEQDWTNHWNNCHGFDCGPYIPNSPTLNKVGREVKNFVLENPDVIIGMIPVIGDLYDAVSGLIGVDPLTGRELSKAEIGLALGAGLLGLFTGADELMDGLALLGRAANKLSPAKLVGKGLDIADKGLGALKTGAKALREIGQAGLSQVDELAQTVSRFGRNAGQVADEVAAAAVDAGRLADNADEAALSLSRMDELMGERRVFSQAETRAAFSGGSEGALSNRLNQCNSFTAGTPVETEEGQKPIEEVEVGDKVLAEDPETGEQGYFEVVALTNHLTDEILKVTVEAKAEKETETLDTHTENGDNDDEAQLNSGADDEHRPTFRPYNLPTLQLTPDHPVYVEGKGWLWAENLAVGDRLRRSDGGWAKVLAVERVKLAEPELVYNFTVKGLHTYFVLEVGVLVHNTDCGFYEDYVEYLEPTSQLRKRVVEPIPGLYENIPLDPNDLPSGWGITNEDVFKSNTISFIDTKVEFDFGDGRIGKGTFSRIYDSESKTLTLRHAYLQDPHVPDVERLPNWIMAGPPLDPSRGTPTVAFFTMYQMKKLDIPFGGLERVKWSEVVNDDTLLHLEWLRRNYPDKPLEELIVHTHSVRYAETSIIQSGHKIVPGSFALKVDPEVPISQLRTAPFRNPNYEELQQFYNLHNVPDDTPIIPTIREITAQVQKAP